MQDLFKRIRLFLKARYPVLLLLTHEEQRVERAIEKLAKQEAREVYAWRSTEGFGADDEEPQAGTAEAEAALSAALQVTKPALLVFYDLHPFLREPRVVRRLKDLAQRVGAREQTVLLVGSQVYIPEEAQKDIVVLDVPLPDRDEVARLLGVLCRSQKIDISPERFERFVKGALGLTEEEIKRLYARILLGGGRFSEEDLSLAIEEKRQAIRRSRHLEFWDSGEQMSDVGGLDSLKGWLRQRSLAFTEKARQFGLPEPKGLFLLGVQGCGKSLMAKAVAELWRMPLLRLDVAAVFEATGREEESLRETIRIAESMAPAVLWIDELEKGFANSSGGGQAFGYFLTWMQEKKKPVFVVATANEVRKLPPELLRKGRFDEIFFVDLPNIHERLEVLEIQLRRRGRDPAELDLTLVAEETDRFSGAELEQVVISGLFLAFAQNRQLKLDDLVDSAREIVPLAVTMDDQLKDLREWARPRARRASVDRRRIDFFTDWDTQS